MPLFIHDELYRRGRHFASEPPRRLHATLYFSSLIFDRRPLRATIALYLICISVGRLLTRRVSRQQNFGRAARRRRGATARFEARVSHFTFAAR